MSDLIARLERQEEELRRMRALLGSNISALRQKDQEIAGLSVRLKALTQARNRWIDGALAAESVITDLQAQLSALRDQQPVAWRWGESKLGPEWRYGEQPNPHRTCTPLYAHPSCVSPDKP